MKAILAEEASVSVLAPHFNPAVNSRSFLELYSFIAESDTQSKPTTLFVLLTKFDIRAWLATQPLFLDRVSILRTIITSLQKFGITPSDEAGMVFGLYRSHMLLLLSDRFPATYSETLRLLIQASDNETLPSCCWGDFLLCIGCHVDGHAIAVYVEHNQLQLSEVTDTVNWLATFFAEISRKYFYSTSKLYTVWRPYIRYLTILLSHLFYKIAEPYLTHGFESELTKER